MEVRYYSSYDRSLEKLPFFIQSRVTQGILELLDHFKTPHQIPHGLGLKKLKHDYWEIRAGLSYRVLFKIEDQILKLVFAGTHEDIRRFLR